ncbi:SPOC like C-terminal domain-containing protein [Xylariomycetidae sp. FL2044]|nr:SPOC like C-terminal domain-containing protein [Xylariomycetidae sp. FL2044]
MADRSHYPRRGEEDDEEEEVKDEYDYRAQKDAVIFAIDVSKSMLQAPPASDDKKADRDSPVYAALKCAYQVMQQRIISNPKDKMAILLFGTEKTKDGDAPERKAKYPHCYIYTDLDIPAAEDVKALKSLVEEGEDADEILVPSSEPVQMNLMLFLANHLFNNNASNFGSRRLFIITDNDDPLPGDKVSKKDHSNHSAQRAKDLFDMGVNIEIFPITRGDQKFDFSKFYDDLIYRDATIDETHPGKAQTSKSGDGYTLLNQLISNISSRQTPKRAYFSNMSLELGPGLAISVKGYNILQKQTPARSCYVWLDGENAQIAVGETAQLAADSARTVEAGEVKQAYKFGGEFVYFTEEEQKSIKQFGDPTIRIIGFKDRPQLRFWASVKKSIFIFPSEEGYVGSTRVFTALWQKLLKSKKIGIAWHIARKNGNPQLVAIVPSRSQSDERSGTTFMPAGLWLCPIPYADDMREGPEGIKVVRTTDELTDKMNTIVRQLQLPGAAYNPSKYPNPLLQWHYKILQALALEEEVPQKAHDDTVPKYKAIGTRCGGYIQEWSQIADDVLGQMKDARAIKREIDGGDDSDDDDSPRPAKRAKPAASKPRAGAAGTTDADLKKRESDGTINKFTVAELKKILGERGIETQGLKKDLVERLEEYIDSV